MENYVLYIAKILGILTTIVVITLIYTSDTTENMYWGQISETTNNTWNTYTMNGGSDRFEAYSNFLNNAQGDTYEAIGE